MNHLCVDFSGLTCCGIKKKIHAILDDALTEKYGLIPDLLIQNRIIDEWEAIERHNAFCDIATLYELTNWLKAQHIPYYMRHSAGSSLILYLLGITSGNPLPPHSYCPVCNKVYWKPLYPDGFDIPQDLCDDFTGTPTILNAPDLSANLHCAADGTPLIHDGHNIPWQTLWGYGDSYLSFNVGLPKDRYNEILEFFSVHWLRKCSSNGVCNEICEGYEFDVKRINISKIYCVFLLDAAEISPVNYDYACTSDDHSYIMQNWRILTAVDWDNASILPEPNSIGDVFSICGMLHSSGVLDEVAQFMMDSMMYYPSELIVFRDDIYQYLINHGFTQEDAWKGMECVRKGRGLLAVTGEMLSAKDHWVINRCEKVRYLCPKAHAVEYVFLKAKLTHERQITHSSSNKGQ